MKTTIAYLRSLEWSMGNGQCPACCGVSQKWLGHPLHKEQWSLGHEKKCQLANSLVECGEKVLFVSAQPREKRETYSVSDEMDRILYNALAGKTDG